VVLAIAAHAHSPPSLMIVIVVGASHLCRRSLALASRTRTSQSSTTVVSLAERKTQRCFFPSRTSLKSSVCRVSSARPRPRHSHSPTMLTAV
jgi:hypothetical protein